MCILLNVITESQIFVQNLRFLFIFLCVLFFQRQPFRFLLYCVVHVNGEHLWRFSNKILFYSILFALTCGCSYKSRPYLQDGIQGIIFCLFAQIHVRLFCAINIVRIQHIKEH